MQKRISRKGLVTVAATILVAFLLVIGSPSISSAQSFNVHVDGFFGTPRPGMLWVWGWDSNSTLEVTFENLTGVYCVLSDQPHEGPEGSSIRLGGTNAGDGTVQPGDIVTVFDGSTTGTHNVMDVKVTAIDYDNDIVSGTALPGTVVHVQNHQGYLPTILATADGSGNWIADYTEEDFDLTYCHGGEAWQTYDDNNSTQFGWFPPMWCTPEDILTIFNGWVEAEPADLEGPGTRGAMRKLLELADDSYKAGDTQQACLFLNIAYQQCDGLPKPKDIVWGDAQYELQTLFLMVMEMPPLQCE